MVKIDKKTYNIGENNFHKVKSVKTQIIIGNSLRKNNYHIIRLQHKEFGNSKEWNTFTISRSGVVYQHFDYNYYSDFIGIKEIDKKSISIMLENMGSLIKIDGNQYKNGLNEFCDEQNVIEKKVQLFEYWENNTNEQIDSLILLCKELCEKNKIPNNCINFYHYNENMDKYKGITFRSNFIQNGNDIPIFDIQNFASALLKNEK